MKAVNSLVQGNKPKSFALFINDDKVKKGIIDRLGGDVQAASRLIATISAAVAGNEKLQACDYGSIVTAALTGEVGMNLSYALGEYGIIPYGNVAKCQIQVNGLKQLCIRSKAYAKIDCFDVREGEFLGRDPKTREPIFKWIEDEEARLELPIVGYYALYMLDTSYNNFFQCLYWSHEQILRHADRYSPGFSLDKYRDLLDGKLSADEVIKLQGNKQKKGSSPWYANPNEEAHMKMCKKTVLKQLLNDGLAPKSIREVIAEDDEIEAGGETEESYFNDDTTGITVVESTGEVIDAPVSDSDAEPTTDTQDAPKVRQKRTRRATEDDEAISNFFGEGDAE